MGLAPDDPRYKIEYERSALAELKRVEPVSQRKAIADAIRDLRFEPRPDGCTKLSGRSGYRIRIGGYRVIYLIDDQADVVTVTMVGNRGAIYKRRN
ncbi:type II toxin-antitoxin system RelE family toxin [Nocardia jiangxiensis]|uniref:type II toxin-antitoxin system RelE family toxin n=1 Tax=Nocardia jiangxiensis TaxID=282685 RepID=UPI001C3F20FA